MTLILLRYLAASSLRRSLFKLVGVACIAGLSTVHAGAQTRPAAPQFTLASLEGAYAYANSLSNVASYAIFRFDGRGGLSVDSMHVNRECSSCTGKREITELTFGTGSYQMNADGTGTVTVTYAYPTSRSYTYEFVVTNAVELAAGKRLAIHLFAAGTTGGLDGQLFAPTFTRQVVPLSNSAR